MSANVEETEQFLSFETWSQHYTLHLLVSEMNHWRQGVNFTYILWAAFTWKFLELFFDAKLFGLNELQLAKLCKSHNLNNKAKFWRKRSSMLDNLCEKSCVSEIDFWKNNTKAFLSFFILHFSFFIFHRYHRSLSLTKWYKVQRC